MRGSARVIALCIGLATSLAPLSASAQPRPQRSPAAPAAGAVDHFKEAVALFERDEIFAACRKFEQSYAEDAAPGTLYNMALCHEREGRFADAYREFDDLATRAEQANRADKAAGIRGRANALLPKLARVDLVHRRDAVAGVTGLTLDGTAFVADTWKKPLYLAPGLHVISIQHADGVTVARTTDRLAAGTSQRIEMEDPAPLPPTPLGPDASAPLVLREEYGVNHGRRTASYVVGGTGLALVAAGAAFGALAIREKSVVDGICPQNNACKSSTDPLTATHDRTTIKTDATLSSVGLAVGGAAVVTAVILFITARQSKANVESGFLVVPDSDGHGAGLHLETRF